MWKDASNVYNHYMKSPQQFVSKYAGTDDFYHNEKIKRTALPHIIYSYRDGEKPNQYNSNLQYGAETIVSAFSIDGDNIVITEAGEYVVAFDLSDAVVFDGR